MKPFSLLLTFLLILPLTLPSPIPLQFTTPPTKYTTPNTFSILFTSSFPKSPFSFYLTTTTGLSNILSISSDESNTQPITDFTTNIIGKAHIITIPYIEHTSFYITITCTECTYYTFIRQHDISLPRSLLTSTTNYEVIPKSKAITFTIPVHSTYNTAHVTLSSFNCALLTSTYNNVKSSGAVISIEITNINSVNAFSVSGSLDKACTVMIDVAYCDNAGDNCLYYLPDDSKHYITANTSNSGVIAYSELSSEMFINNYMNNNLQVKQFNTATSVFTRDIFPLMTNAIDYNVTITTLNNNRSPVVGESIYNEYEITFKQNKFNIPIHLSSYKINRDYIGNNIKTFYMSIPSTEGNLYVHQYGEYISFCVRVKNKHQRDVNANWMHYTDLTVLCDVNDDDQVQFDKHEERIYISSSITSKCKDDDACDLFITFMPTTVNVATNGIDVFNEITIYYQEAQHVVDVAFNEAINGAFDENEVKYNKYYRYHMSYGVDNVMVVVDKAVNDIKVYINQGTTVPNVNEWNYVLNDESVKVERKVIPVSQRMFTLMVMVDKYVEYNSQFRIVFIPQFKNVQWLYSVVAFGETAYCDVNSGSNGNKCAFVVAVPKRNVNNNVLYFNIESEHEVKATNVAVNILSHDYTDITFINSFIEYTINEAALSTYLSSKPSHNLTYTNTNYIRIPDSTSLTNNSLLYIEYTFNTNTPHIYKLFSHWEYPKPSLYLSPIFHNKYIYIPQSQTVTLSFDILPSMYTQLTKVENTLISFINFTDSIVPSSSNEFTNTYIFESPEPHTSLLSNNKISFINAGNYSGVFILSSFPKATTHKPFHTLYKNKLYTYTSTERFHVSVSDQLTDAFTIIITTLKGQASINEVYNNTAMNLNMSLFNVHLMDQQMRLELNANAKFGRTHEAASNFFFDVNCVNCVYQISRNDTHMNAENTTLYKEFTNYLLINASTHYFAHINADENNVQSYKYQAQINSLDCALAEISTLAIGTVIKHDTNNKVVVINEIPSNENYVFRIKATNAYQRATCKIVVNVSSKGNVNNVVYFNLTENALHHMLIDDKTKQLTFTSAARKGDVMSIHVNNYHQYVMQMQCGNATKRTVIGREVYIYTKQNDDDLCTLTVLTTSFTNKYEVSVIIKQENVHVPMFYPRDYYIKEYVPLNERSVFYMTIPSIEGKLVIHQPHVVGNVCIRIENHLTRDATPNMNFLIDVDTICANSITHSGSGNGNSELDYTNEISYELNTQITGKCSSSDCEMYILIQPKVELNSANNGDLSNREITMYLIEKSQIVYVPFFEQVYGSFIHSGDTNIVYYTVKVPYNVNGLYINIDKHEDNVILYIKEGKDKPDSASNSKYVLDKDIDMSLLISTNEDDTLQGKQFTFGVKPNAHFVEDKMHYKLTLEPKYKTSPVQVSHVHIGESGICNVDYANLYCVFMVYIHNTHNNGWYFYVDFPYDAQLQSDSDNVSINIKTIEYDSNMKYNDLFIYGNSEEGVNVYFPRDNQDDVITLTNTRFYYDNSNSKSDNNNNDLSAMLIKVNLPRPAITKIYTNYYTPQIDFMRSLFIFEKQVYHIKRNDYLTLMYYNDNNSGILTEICNITNTNTCYHDTNTYDDVDTKTYQNITIDNTNSNTDNTFTLSLHRDYMHTQPTFYNYTNTNYINFSATTTNEQDMIMLLPLNTKINIHIFCMNNTDFPQSIGANFNIHTKLINPSIYKSILLNTFNINDETTTINLQNETDDTYKYASITSPANDASYLYIKIIRKARTTNANDDVDTKFEIITLEESKGSTHLVREDEPMTIYIMENTNSGEIRSIGYSVEIPKQSKYVIELTQSLTTSTVSDFHLTSVPWNKDKENLTWYIDDVEKDEDGMRIYITDKHRSTFGVGFYFEGDGKVKYELKVYTYRGFNKLLLIPICIGIALIVIIIILGDRLRKKKRMEASELIKKFGMNMGMPRGGIEDEAPAPLMGGLTTGGGNGATINDVQDGDTSFGQMEAMTNKPMGRRDFDLDDED